MLQSAKPNYCMLRDCIGFRLSSYNELGDVSGGLETDKFDNELPVELCLRYGAVILLLCQVCLQKQITKHNCDHKVSKTVGAPQPAGLRGAN